MTLRTTLPLAVLAGAALLAPAPVHADVVPVVTTDRSATSTPVPTPSHRPDCGAAQAATANPTPVAGDLTGILVRSEFGPAAGFTLARLAPAPVAVVRSDTATAAAGGRTTTFTVRLPETTTLRLTVEGVDGCPDSSVVFVQPVAARVSLAAVRRAPRAYVFSGRVTPASGSVTLYRVEGSGRRVITARADVGPDGDYRIDRRFLGSGRFGFVAVAHPGPAARSTGGSSAVRPTVVH